MEPVWSRRTPAAFKRTSWLTDNESHTGCLEDVFVRQYDFRLTMTSVDYQNDSAWLDPLRHLLQQSVGSPDAIVVGIGAWFAKAPGVRQFPHVARAFTDAVRTLLDDIEHSLDQHRSESYFRPTWPSSHPRLISWEHGRVERCTWSAVPVTRDMSVCISVSTVPFLPQSAQCQQSLAPEIWLEPYCTCTAYVPGYS